MVNGVIIAAILRARNTSINMKGGPMTKDNVIRFSLHIPEKYAEQHLRARHLAVDKGVSTQEIYFRALRQYLSEPVPDKGGK